MARQQKRMRGQTTPEETGGTGASEGRFGSSTAPSPTQSKSVKAIVDCNIELRIEWEVPIPESNIFLDRVLKDMQEAADVNIKELGVLLAEGSDDEVTGLFFVFKDQAIGKFQFDAILEEAGLEFGAITRWDIRAVEKTTKVSSIDELQEEIERRMQQM